MISCGQTRDAVRLDVAKEREEGALRAEGAEVRARQAVGRQAHELDLAHRRRCRETLGQLGFHDRFELEVGEEAPEVGFELDG